MRGWIRKGALHQLCPGMWLPLEKVFPLFLQRLSTICPNFQAWVLKKHRFSPWFQATFFGHGRLTSELTSKTMAALMQTGTAHVKWQHRWRWGRMPFDALLPGLLEKGTSRQCGLSLGRNEASTTRHSHSKLPYSKMSATDDSGLGWTTHRAQEQNPGGFRFGATVQPSYFIFQLLLNTSI